MWILIVVFALAMKTSIFLLCWLNSRTIPDFVLGTFSLFEIKRGKVKKDLFKNFCYDFIG